MAIPKVGKVREQGAAVGASLRVIPLRGHVVQVNTVAVINLVLRVLHAQAALRVRVVEVPKVLAHKQVRVAPQVANSSQVLSKVVRRRSSVSLAKVDQGAQAAPADLLVQVVRVVHLNKVGVAGRVQVRVNQVVEQNPDPAIQPPDRHPKGTTGNRVAPPRMSLG